MLILHDNIESGNAYKVRLLLSHLGRPFKSIQYDVTRGETRTAEYLETINANGRIPGNPEVDQPHREYPGFCGHVSRRME